MSSFHSINDYINRIDVNIISIIVLFLILFSIGRKNERNILENRIIRILCVSTITLLFLDSLGWLVEGRSGFILRYFNLSINTVMYVLNPVPTMMWTLYAYFSVSRNRIRFRLIAVAVSIPAVVNGIISIASLFSNYMFYIDESNTYHRGPGFWILSVIGYGYIFFTLAFVLVKRKHIDIKNFVPYLFSVLAPVAGGTMQALFYGVATLWPSMTISVLILYVLIQNERLTTDYLTGIGNRRSLDAYLEDCFSRQNKNSGFGAVMIDVDDFKSINDRFGHKTGDAVLEKVALIIRQSIRKGDLAARYAGDEFVVILETPDREIVHNAVERIHKAISVFRMKEHSALSVSLSTGFEICHPADWKSPDDIIRHIDTMMYEQKRNKKRSRRVNTENCAEPV